LAVNIDVPKGEEKCDFPGGAEVGYRLLHDLISCIHNKKNCRGASEVTSGKVFF
jgi:hypothetical protein